MTDDAVAPEPVRQTLIGDGDIDEWIDRLVGMAQQHVALFDRTLSPRWDRPERVDVLRRFCLASRRNSLRIVLHEPEAMVRHTPRLRGLLETFGHVMSVHRTRDEALSARDALVIIDQRHVLHRLHVDQPRAVLILEDPAAARPLCDRFEQIWAASDLGLSGTTLGL